MYICICTGLDEKQLKELCHQGTDTLPKLKKQCGAGGDCGTCAFKINRYLKQFKSEDQDNSTVSGDEDSSAHA